MWIIYALLPLIVHAQVGGDDVAENADNFRKLYGIATKIMELSGNIMGGGSGGGGGGSDEVRPRFQGVRSFSQDNSILNSGSSPYGINNMAKMLQEYQGMFANAKFVQPTTTTTTERPAGFKAIIDSFLGTGNNRNDDDSENLPPPPTPKPRPRQNLFSLLGAPTHQSNDGNEEVRPNLLSNLFGFAATPPTTTTTTTEPTPVQKIMNIFVPQSSEPSSSGRGRLNILELFGMAPTTTTTQQPPLQALFNPSRPYNGGPEDIDGIMNALMRTNARPARQEPASLISQFFG